MSRRFAIAEIHCNDSSEFRPGDVFDVPEDFFGTPLEYHAHEVNMTRMAAFSLVAEKNSLIMRLHGSCVSRWFIAIEVDENGRDDNVWDVDQENGKITATHHVVHDVKVIVPTEDELGELAMQQPACGSC